MKLVLDQIADILDGAHHKRMVNGGIEKLYIVLDHETANRLSARLREIGEELRAATTEAIDSWGQKSEAVGDVIYYDGGKE